MSERVFYSDCLNHCYQRTAGRGVLFYDTLDHLVFFTVYCTMAVRYRVRVFKVVQMPDHIHHSLITKSLSSLSAFCRDVTATYAKEYNRAHGRSGPLFESPFGSAAKRGDKAVRTNLLYLDNNPVERKLVRKAEEYRWNYMAFANSTHPFSERILLRKASMPLRRALKRVVYLHEQKIYLRFSVLRRMFDTISSHLEREQLIDFIISTYSVIEYKTVLRYFGSYEAECIAAHSSSGSEYDINEVFIGRSDTCYAQFSQIIMDAGLLRNIHDIFGLSESEKRKIYSLLRQKTGAPHRQISAFLQLPVEITR